MSDTAVTPQELVTLWGRLSPENQAAVMQLLQSLARNDELAELRRRLEELEDRLEGPALLRLHQAALAEDGEPFSVEQVRTGLGIPELSNT
jgi:hypothetical protein